MAYAVNKANPTRTSTHINRPLSNIAIAFMQQESQFVASRVFPNVPVDKQSDSYFIWDRGDMNRDEAMEVGPGGEAPITGLRVSNDSYFAKVYKLAALISDQERANTDDILNPDMMATQSITRKLLIKKERLWASAYFTTGKWTGSTSGTDIVPAVLWDVYATSEPIVDIRTQAYFMAKQLGVPLSELVLTIGPEAWVKLLDHPKFLERFEQVQASILNEQLVASVLGIGRVLVPMATVNTAKEGATASMSFINGKSALLSYSPSAPAKDAPSAGYTFVWKGLTGTEDGMQIKRFRREVRDSDQIEGQISFDHKLVSPICGVFFSGVVS